ncbi:MAG: ABC transporter ATP-binding protein [Clostridium sp.]
MLDFKNITFKYPNTEHKVIDDLSFKINKGDFVSIIGASGCGKSTIFRLISSLEKTSIGEILIEGKNISNFKSKIGYMPQKDLLLPFRTILQNASIPLEIQGKSKFESNNIASDLLKEFGLHKYESKFPKDLSGGMKQRISFIRTLLTGANLMILDEPFSALDALTKMTMQEWLLNQKLKYDKTILFITHDVDEAIFLSNKILVVTDTPIKSLKEISVPLPKERTHDMMNCCDIIKLKESLIEQLRPKVSI